MSGGTIGSGGLNFAQINAAPAAGTAISASGVTLTGALNIGGLDIDGSGTGVAFSNLSGAGSLNLTGTLDLDTGGLAVQRDGAFAPVKNGQCAQHDQQQDQVFQTLRPKITSSTNLLPM